MGESFSGFKHKSIYVGNTTFVFIAKRNIRVCVDWG